MSNQTQQPSLDSMEQQIAKLKTQETALNQSILLKQNLLKNLEEKQRQNNESLQRELDSKREKRLAEIDGEVEQRQTVLDDLDAKVEARKKTLKQLSDDTEASQNALIQARQGIVEIQHEEAELRKSIISAREMLDIAEGALAPLQQQKTQLLKDMDTAQTETGELQGEVTRLSGLKESLSSEVGKIKITLDEKTKEYDKTIAEYEARIKSLAERMAKIYDEEKIIRADLASQQAMLDEKDKNLRIREAKVQEGEGTLLRNANLLNL